MEKLVLVDDDVEIRKVAELRLRAAGYEVLSAADGEAGLELIRRERPRVVILDLMMPKLHGYAVCQAIRSDPALRHIHVIITSAKSYAVDIQKAKDVGADVYLVKPYDLEELAAKVAAALQEGGPPLQVRFWGTRGSIPTPGKATARYGGNTSCVEVRCRDTIVMLDCGSGAREMGLALAQEFRGKPVEAHIFISHTHWDHIQGFPFFNPAYYPGSKITLYSLRGADKSLEKVFTGQMDASYFPVSLADMMGKLRFVELEGVVEVGEMKISHIYLNHPGLAVGFRIEAGKRSVVYVTDHEPYWRLLGDNEHNRRLDREITDFARGAGLYIREAQYTDEEYPGKRSWGHSTWSDALHAAQDAGVQMLALYHHDPMRDDDSLDAIVAECKKYMKKHEMNFLCFAASDGMQINV
jgi:phosphoribosyl 1,2-cyclic phosphodiesterase/CheY-like chemotaxis protein